MRFSAAAGASLLVVVISALSSSTSAQEIRRVSAPVVNKTWTIDYASTAGNVFVMFLAAHSNNSINVPGIGNTFRLDLATLLSFYGGGVPPSGVHTQGVPIPNWPGLVGASFSIQAFDFTPPSTYKFSTNAVDVTVSGGIGKILLVEGTSTATTIGDLVLESVDDATAGAPVVSALPKYAPQAILNYGNFGWRPLVAAGSSVVQGDQHLDSLKEPARDVRDTALQSMKLPNGYDLYVCRDFANQKKFYLVSVHRASSVAKVLTGSEVTDVGTTAQPASNFHSQFAFTADGEIAMCTVHDSTNTPTPKAGPADRIFLVKTDFNKTWSNSLNVVDVSPAAGPDKMWTAYNASQRFGNGWGFVIGEDPDGTSGAAAMWFGKLDGTPWTRLAIPNTGTNFTFYWHISTWRQNRAGSVDIFINGGNPASSASDRDYIAIVDIDPAKTPKAINITKFATATVVQAPGSNGIGSTNLRASVSPDGKNAAIIIGTNSAQPTGIAIVPTDGSKAGTVTDFTTADFDVQVDTFGEVHWLSNSKLLFAAGSATNTFDYYIRDISGTPVTTNLTKTCTGSKTPPFTQGGDTGNISVLGSLVSDNAKYYYFVRGYTSTTVGFANNIVGISDTGALVDITGSEFAAGTAPAIRGVSTTIYTWQARRHPATNHMYFVAGKVGTSTTNYNDDNVWRFDPETASAAVMVTNNTGSGTTTDILRIDDLTLHPAWVAYARGKGTATTEAENVFITPFLGGAAIQLSRSPATGGMGIRQGSLRFTPNPFAGICWVQGTGSRTLPTANAGAWWNRLVASSAPLLLTALPTVTAKNVLVVNAGQ